MKLNKRWMIVLIVSGLLISALVAAFALTGSRTSVAAAASAQITDACVDDDNVASETENEADDAAEAVDDDDVASETESEADDAAEAEDADCPGDVEDELGRIINLRADAHV
jgi:hypothetical protein